MNRGRFGRIAFLAATAIGSLLAVSAASAFTMATQSPVNGHVVVIRGDETWVDFTMQFNLDGCLESPYSLLNVSGPFKYTPLSGHGKSFTSPVYASDHLSYPPLWQPTATSYVGRVSTYIPGWLVSNGETVRWSVEAWCAAPHVSGSGGGDYIYTTTTGTLRIKKPGSGFGSGGSNPPRKTPPPTRPPTKNRRPGHGRTTTPFRITRIDSPSSVLQNGPRGIATIHWSGHPSFPVTMHDSPASCPAAFTCTAETKVAAQRANPLNWAAWWCAGDVAADWTLDYWFWLTDAKGQRTQKVREQVTCSVG